jgi:hypothetical protein
MLPLYNIELAIRLFIYIYNICVHTYFLYKAQCVKTKVNYKHTGFVLTYIPPSFLSICLNHSAHMCCTVLLKPHIFSSISLNPTRSPHIFLHISLNLSSSHVTTHILVYFSESTLHRSVCPGGK